ncbi:MAG: GTP-binding protein [Candidatus Altiarchaeota archaeon]
MAYEEKIKELEDEITRTKKNKATEMHIGLLKARIAELKERDVTLKRGKSKGLGFGVKKTGHATVVFVGLPSVGKSTLINALTNATSKVAAYEFTTLDVVPGMMNYGGVSIQLLDVPGLITGAAGGKGRGREILSMVRNAELALIVLDPNRIPTGVEIKNELEGVGVRLDKKPPEVVIKKRDKGGLKINSTLKQTRLTEEEMKALIVSNGILNADVIVRQELTAEELVDAVRGNRVYIPSVVVVNKMDIAGDMRLPRDYLPISAANKTNLDRLREEIFRKLRFIRVYLKPQGGKADYGEPMILKEGSTIRDMCGRLHKDFLAKFRYALVWGASVKHDGQRVGLGHILKDKDTVSIVREL